MSDIAARETGGNVARLAVGIFLLFAHVRPPDGQIFDHLRCFKVRDTAKFVATATVDASVAQFGNGNCQIEGRAKLFCVPSDTTVTSFTDKSATGIPPAPYAGEELSGARVCYRIKCPKMEIAAELATDPFGTRTFEKFKSRLLCTPAVLGTRPPTTTTTLPPLAPCNGGSSWPTCDGDCSALGSTYACERRDDMTCACLQPCANLDPGQRGFCSQGGGCPVDSRCEEVLGVCTCVFSP